MGHLQNELKQEFQLERMILFSDAVFAIAITLLVIDLKIPHLSGSQVTEARLGQILRELFPSFMGFLNSFFIIGLFWIIHHRMFGYVVRYNRKLLVLNLIFLLWIVLMPFSTSFYSEYVSYFMKSPVIVYISNVCLLGITNIVLWHYISNPKHNLSEGLHPLVARYFLMRSFITPSIFLSIGLIYLFINPYLAICVFPFVPLVIRLVTKKRRKELKRLDISF